MTACLIGLGSNLGDRVALLRRATALLVERGDVHLRRQSAFHETAPVGGPADQPQYLNAALLVETQLGAEHLHERMKQIERHLGRRPGARWAPRPVDLDLLLYGHQCIDQPGLQVPHPRMAWRRFVLAPAAEVASDMVHPLIGWTIGQLLEHLDTAVPYVAICGLPGVGKTELLNALAGRLETSHQVVRLQQVQVERVLQAQGCPLAAEKAAGKPRPYTSPSEVAQHELQLLRVRSGLLAADHPQWLQKRTLWISDFWIGQSLAYGRVRLAENQWNTLRQQYAAVESRVVRPKLIVFLDAAEANCSTTSGSVQLQSGEALPCDEPARTAAAGSIQPNVLAELRHLVRRPGLGPVLHLEAEKPNDNLEETLAAIQASE